MTIRQIIESKKCSQIKIKFLVEEQSPTISLRSRKAHGGEKPSFEESEEHFKGLGQCILFKYAKAVKS